MRDFASQVKALREGAEWAEKFCAHETAKRQSDAADAIEELLAENKAIKQSNKDAAMRNKLLCDEISRMKEKVPKWVSVEERLPEFHMNDSGCVCTKNIVFRTEYKTVHLGYVIRTAHNIETVEGFEQILTDRWYDQTGDMIEGVTHWMPLPEPPKGGNHDN